LNLSMDKIEVKDPEEKIDSNGKSETCRAFERQSRRWTPRLSLISPFRVNRPAGKTLRFHPDSALPEKFSQRDLAMPSDVRKRSALPSISHTEFGAAPQNLGVARNSISNLPEGRRPSAHQTAQPYL